MLINQQVYYFHIGWFCQPVDSNPPFGRILNRELALKPCGGLQQHRNQQRHNVQILMGLIWASSVLIRITDSVTGHCCLMCRRFFTAKVASFDIFFGIVPSSSACGHSDRHK